MDRHKCRNPTCHPTVVSSDLNCVSGVMFQDLTQAGPGWNIWKITCVYRYNPDGQSQMLDCWRINPRRKKAQITFRSNSLTQQISDWTMTRYMGHSTSRSPLSNRWTGMPIITGTLSIPESKLLLLTTLLSCCIRVQFKTDSRNMRSQQAWSGSCGAEGVFEESHGASGWIYPRLRVL